MRRIFTALFSFLTLFLFCEEIKVYSLPKSGTYLVSTILQQLEEINYKYNIQHLTDIYGNPIDISGKRVINIRDLRDYFVSLRHFTNKVVKVGLETGCNWPGFKPIHQYQAWLSMSDDEQLMALITLNQDIPYWENNIINNIKFADVQFQQSSYDSNILITRFEFWIGEKGGGSALNFAKQLEAFLNHFGYSISSQESMRIYGQFYGKSKTFDKGKIGRWKDEFQEEHIIAFKKLWNKYLINWGYETEENW